MKNVKVVLVFEKEVKVNGEAIAYLYGLKKALESCGLIDDFKKLKIIVGDKDDI